MPLTIPVKILQGQKVQFLPVEMVNLSAPPAGVSVQKTSVNLVDNAVPAAVSIVTPLSQGKKESLTLSIPAGTQFKDEAGNTLSGSTLSVALLHFDARTAASLNAYPGGRRSSNLIKEASGTTTSGYFQTAGFVYIKCSLDGKNVATFSKSAVAVMEVSNQQWNPQAGRNFMAGDVLPIYRFTPGEAVWTAAGSSTISSTGGKLKAQFSMSRAVPYSLAFAGSTCSESQIVFNTGVAESEVFRVDIFFRK